MWRKLKIYGLTEIRTRTYYFGHHRTVESIYLKIRLLGENTLIKKRTYWKKVYLHIKICGEI